MRATVLLLIAVCLWGVAQSSTINAQRELEYEVIYLDYPNFIHALHHNPQTGLIYAFGDGQFRQINHVGGPFQAVDNLTISEYNQPWIDLRIFNTPGSSDMWMIGPTFYRQGAGQTATNIGYFMPLAYAGPPPSNYASLQGDKRGYTFFAVSVDTRSYPHVRAYFVGWAQGPLNAGVAAESVGFVVVRAAIDLSQPPVARAFTWQDPQDIAVLYEDKYRPYHSTYRPYIIHDYTENKLVIIDPETTSMWSVTAPADGTSPLVVNGGTLDLSPYGRLAGVNWHNFEEILYLGFSTDGSGNGSLLAVSTRSLTILYKYVFDGYHSNPRAIAGYNNTLYIGFEGGPSILKFDLPTWKVVGHVHLPDNLNQVYAAWDSGYDHIYFATYEQHSKVYRIRKTDFCGSPCPWNGWCEAGACHCPEGTSVSADGTQCVRPAQPTPAPSNSGTSDKGAAIALGILFALSFIAAVVGWVLFIRKSQGYQRVL